MTKYLKIFPREDYNKGSLHLLAGIVNLSAETKKKGLISFYEFQNFEKILNFPDALYRTAFQLFDNFGKGRITFDEFINIMKRTEFSKKIKLNENSKLLKLYFGINKERLIDYSEFRQLLHDYRKENFIEAFKKYDKNGKGYISVNDFIYLMINMNGHLLTSVAEMRLKELDGEKGKWVSFPSFMAFNSMLNNMELFIKLYLQITNKRKNVELSKEEFMRTALTMSSITPLQVDILYEFCDTKRTGKIKYKDLNEIAPYLCLSDVSENVKQIDFVSGPGKRSIIMQVLESLYRFALAAIAGAVGASAVYPIDLVKTRLQNQRTGAEQYKNGLDCFRKVIKHEGYLGLYSGLLPVLIGVAPEQATKLTINDFVRDKFTEKDGYIPLPAEILAGGSAGFGQALVANPLEVLKIRLQVSGEAAGKEKNTLIAILKEIGLAGLYKGVHACMIRDIFFSGIYLPAYSNLKLILADENGYNNKSSLIMAGLIAGAPTAWCLTPVDVIKTRLQVAKREGRTTYKGILDAGKKIWREEGMRAFFKGSIPRVLKISPALAITLTVYEILQRLIYIDFGGFRPAGSEVKPKKTSYYMSIEENPDLIGGYKSARPVFEGMETRFGLSLPKI